MPGHEEAARDLAVGPPMDVKANQPPAAIDLGRSLDEGAWSSLQKLVMAMVVFGFTVDGMPNPLFGLAIPALAKAWSLPAAAFAPVTALGYVAMALGTLAGGVAGDRFGRRFGLIASLLLFGLATGATARAAGLANLFFFRTLACLGLGGAIPNCAALLAEFTPLRYRSMAMAVGIAFVSIGGLLAGALGTYILPRFGWQSLLLSAGAVPVALAFVLLAALPESPRFLLRRLHRRAELLRLLGRMGHRMPADSVFVDERQKAAHQPISALLGAGARRDTLAIWAFSFFCYLSSYSIFSWTPTLLASAGLGLSESSSSVSAYFFGGTIGGLASGWILQRHGSRRAGILFGAGGLFGAVALALMSQAPSHFRSFAALLAIEGLFIAAMNTTILTLSAYVYPTPVKATGVGAAAAVGRIGGIVSSFIAVVAIESGGAAGFFSFIAAAIAVSLGSQLIVRKQIPIEDARDRWRRGGKSSLQPGK